jgi:spoIIIJ-associated protein
MNPYERRIIHTAVQKINGAISWSEGENTSRHVVIGPDPKAKNNRRGGYNNRRGGRKGGYNANRKTNPAPNPDRVPLNEGGATGLYGRIDK